MKSLFSTSLISIISSVIVIQISNHFFDLPQLTFDIWIAGLFPVLILIVVNFYHLRYWDNQDSKGFYRRPVEIIHLISLILNPMILTLIAVPCLMVFKKAFNWPLP